ncbi:MAG: undecaprenyl-diphosphate phosphatase [Solobacterium sp.]|nr:undecaprenyl-diphosphate phosphatase [Solobacterium sp.]
MTFLLNLLKSILFGIVQGITEWLPVSSTAHLILLERFLPLNVFEDAALNQAYFDMYKVLIQLGSIIAVALLYKNRLNPFQKNLAERKKDSMIDLWKKIIIACIPAGIIGVVLNDYIDAKLSSPLVIAGALIVYGIAFIVLEQYKRPVTVKSTRRIGFKEAIGVGLFQVLSLIPGTSRCGSTILGARLLGFNRTTAVEFSFFMAIPVMLGASLVKIIKLKAPFSFAAFVILLAGMVTAFFISVIVIRKFLAYIKKHNFKVFGAYRIIIGAVVLVLTLTGLLV